MLWVCHAPVGSRHARVNDVSPSVTLGVHPSTPSVPEEVTDKLNDPTATVVVGTVVVVATTGESMSSLVTLTATSVSEEPPTTDRVTVAF